MATTFMDNDYWAKKKGATQFLSAAGPTPPSGSGYLDKNDYPPAATLDLFREDAYGLIVTEADGVPELDEKYLRNLKVNALEPFANNTNFRNAIKEYKTKEFTDKYPQ